MATDGRRGLVGRKSNRRIRHLFIFRFRLGIGFGFDLSHQSFRSVRFAAGLVLSLGKTLRASEIRHARSVSHRAASALCRLVFRFLDDTADDIRAFMLFRCHDCLHSVGDSIRGTRPCTRTRRFLRTYRREVPMLVPFFGKRKPVREETFNAELEPKI